MPLASTASVNPFEDFFKNPVYLEYKNHLYNYRLRRGQIRKRLTRKPSPGLILEMGSGVSTMSEGLGDVVFSDLSHEAMQYLRAQGISSKTLTMSVTDIAFRDQSVDTIVCSEVLEHVPEDERALREMLRVLKPGGRMILTVPAHPRYYAFDDRFVSHERRYAVWPFLRRLRKIGFTNLELVKVTGVLDKLATIILTFTFSLLGSGGSKNKEKSGRIAAALMRLMLPFYKLANWIYARLAQLEAKASPLALTAVILVECRRPA